MTLGLGFFGRQMQGVLLAGAGLLLAACDAPSSAPTSPFGGFGNADPVEVALLVPTGSGSAELDAIAQGLENAARLAVADLNGVTVNLTVYSTRRDTNTAVAAANDAVASGADIILGPLDGQAAAAVGVALRQRATNVLSFSNDTALGGGNVFLLGQTFPDSARRVSDYARSQGTTRITVVHAETRAGEAGRAAATAAIQQSGLAVAGTASYENSLPGIAAATGAIRSTLVTNGADAIFLTSSGAGALPILADLLPEAGVTPEEIQYLGLSRWDADPRLFSIDGVQGGWFPMPDRGRQAAFNNRYSSAYGAAPPLLASLAYDGIAIIGALWAQGGAEPLNTSALTRGDGFQGATGIIRLRVDGTNQRGLAVGSIQNGQVVTLDPAPQAFGGGGF